MPRIEPVVEQLSCIYKLLSCLEWQHNENHLNLRLSSRRNRIYLCSDRNMRCSHGILKMTVDAESGLSLSLSLSLSDECASMLVSVLDFTRFASRREITGDCQHINNDPTEFYLLLFFKEFIVFMSKLTLY